MYFGWMDIVRLDGCEVGCCLKMHASSFIMVSAQQQAFLQKGKWSVPFSGNNLYVIHKHGSDVKEAQVGQILITCRID